ncbi:MAG: twin-arginine translocation signal domain-containing protein [Phycisphaera sp.]|nr:twin-arginine translocation signal domain-containing protein [Phycisphaera sp.]
MSNDSTRRTFLKQSGAAVTASALVGAVANTAHAKGSDEIKFALIGCGGRGTGASNQIMNSKGNTKLIAVADAFHHKAEGAIKNLAKAHNDKVAVPDDHIFSGFDAYKFAIDADPDLVVIATPPAFKTPQFEYAVEKGKHIFCEKPLGTDAPMIRRFFAANEIAKKKNLMVAIGLQRHHEERYLDTIKRCQDGAIGDINLVRVYWNGGGIWYRTREDISNSLGRPATEMEFQTNNWYHFIWSCGDQICEQHIHNLDVGCWLKNMYPVECNGMGGGEERMGGDDTKSQIFDHTFCEYTFPDGTKMYSQGRHLGGKKTYKEVAEFAHGSKGTAQLGAWIKPFEGDQYRTKGRGDGHQQEQLDLIDTLMKGEIYNEGDYGAKSTFTAILGREACYSGQVVKWDDLLAKGKDYSPGIDKWTLESAPPTVPGPDGKYWTPHPGEYDPFS